MSQPKPKQRYLPLREITLTSRPLVKRALAFSSDGELAVAADDSVHVLVPEFPDLPTRLVKRETLKLSASAYPDPTTNGVINGSGSSDNEQRDKIASIIKGRSTNGQEGDGEESSGEEWTNSYENYRINTRAQYSEGSKHMPVSYPPLDPRINKELFANAGLPFPWDGDAGGVGIEGPSDGESEESEEESEESEDDSEEFTTNVAQHDADRPFGAGYGPITGAGSTMNHVVCVAWSPSGLGVNLRPILAILTSSGLVAMYGDGGKLDNVLPRANEGMLQRRELNSWIVLWGLGERLMVPGQQADVTENIQGIAWAKEVAPGQALLATVNDVGEVAIVSVQSTLAAEGKKANPSEGSGERIEWRVQEVGRFKKTEPHPKVDLLDPDFTPCGTSFGLKFSPWITNGASRSCILSYIDRNYMGFRRVTVHGPWVRGEVPNVTVGDTDSFGRCVHLSTDAFIGFEDTVWPDNGAQICRGLLATPFHLVPFEISLSHDTELDPEKHPTSKCGTTYADESLPYSENPIVDLVIHPPDPSNPAPMPLYTLIRLSATTTNHEWYESNLPPPLDENSPTSPQWARDIAEKLEIAVPADMHRKRGYDEEMDSEGSASESDSEMEDDDDEMGSDIDDVPQGPEIHPHRFRLHGLAISPGGGATAVLTSSHNTQHPERGGWHTVRSTVHFGYKPRIRTKDFETVDFGPQSESLTIEGRLFEYLYGGGPPVPGINIPVEGDNPLSESRQQERQRLRDLFAEALATQKCDLCGTKLGIVDGAKRHGPGLSGCRKGHFFSTCATSGLAVQMPGITRCCGTCGLRSIRTTALAKMAGITEDVVKEVNGCGWCGGKFLN